MAKFHPGHRAWEKNLSTSLEAPVNIFKTETLCEGEKKQLTFPQAVV
jgi:hypothetical protein